MLLIKQALAYSDGDNVINQSFSPVNGQEHSLLTLQIHQYLITYVLSYGHYGPGRTIIATSDKIYDTLEMDKSTVHSIRNSLKYSMMHTRGAYESKVSL